MLIPFKVEHLRGLVNREGPWQEPESLIDEKVRGGPAFTALADGRVLGCAGIVIPWPGVGLVWMTLAPGVERHGVWLTRTAKRILRDLTSAYRLHRLESLTFADSLRHQQWVEALGFVQEKNGRAREYTSDRKDMIRYEWVRGV